MRTIYRIYLSFYGKEGKLFFSNEQNAHEYAKWCVSQVGGYYRLVPYQDCGQTKCYDDKEGAS